MTRTTTMADATSRNPFAVCDFRLQWIGEAVSSVGAWLALVILGFVAEPAQG